MGPRLPPVLRSQKPSGPSELRIPAELRGIFCGFELPSKIEELRRLLLNRNKVDIGVEVDISNFACVRVGFLLYRKFVSS